MVTTLFHFFSSFQAEPFENFIPGEAPVQLAQVKVSPSSLANVLDYQPALTTLILECVVEKSGKRDAISEVGQEWANCFLLSETFQLAVF